MFFKKKKQIALLETRIWALERAREFHWKTIIETRQALCELRALSKESNSAPSEDQ